ncbi:MAG: hypothetical protein ACRDIA_06935, partial [Actinomycetota bacterium]
LVWRFGRILRALYWISDLAFMPLLAEDLASFTDPGKVNMGNTPYFNVLWWLMATKHLPFHRAIWAAGPYLLSAATVVLIALGARKVSGTWAGGLTLILGLGASWPVLMTTLPPGSRVSTWFANAVMAGLLMHLIGRDSFEIKKALPVTVAAIAVAAATAGSDPLFYVSGLGPFVLAVGLAVFLHPEVRRDSRALVAASAVAVSVLAGAVASRWMNGLGYRANGPAFIFASMDEVLDNSRSFMDSMLAMANGQFQGRLLGPGALAVLASAVAAFVALVVCGRLVFHVLSGRVRDANPAFTAWVCFWGVSMLGVSASLVLTKVAVGAGLASTRYLIPVFYAVVALIGVCASAKTTRQWLAAGAAALFIFLGWRSQTRFYLPLDRTPIVARGPDIVRFLESRNVRRGYAGYWTAHSFTWNSRLLVKAYPINACALGQQTGYCPFPLAVRDRWYTPRNGPSFLLLDPDAPLPLGPEGADALGKPTVTKRFDRITVLLYDHDIAADFSRNP